MTATILEPFVVPAGVFAECVRLASMASSTVTLTKLVTNPRTGQVGHMRARVRLCRFLTLLGYSEAQIATLLNLTAEKVHEHLERPYWLGYASTKWDATKGAMGVFEVEP